MIGPEPLEQTGRSWPSEGSISVRFGAEDRGVDAVWLQHVTAHGTPATDDRRGGLGVELDGQGASQPKRLHAHGGSGDLDRTGWKLEPVEVHRHPRS